jgi:hypothetical protein
LFHGRDELAYVRDHVAEDPASPAAAGGYIMACMAFFVTLCEAYMVIDPHFDMWNYFFHTRL